MLSHIQMKAKMYGHCDKLLHTRQTMFKSYASPVLNERIIL